MYFLQIHILYHLIFQEAESGAESDIRSPRIADLRTWHSFYSPVAVVRVFRSPRLKVSDPWGQTSQASGRRRGLGLDSVKTLEDNASCVW